MRVMVTITMAMMMMAWMVPVARSFSPVHTVNIREGNMREEDMSEGTAAASSDNKSQPQVQLQSSSALFALNDHVIMFDLSLYGSLHDLQLHLQHTYGVPLDIQEVYLLSNEYRKLEALHCIPTGLPSTVPSGRRRQYPLGFLLDNQQEYRAVPR
jgi:hypothetical protein